MKTPLPLFESISYFRDCNIYSCEEYISVNLKIEFCIKLSLYSKKCVYTLVFLRKDNDHNSSVGTFYYIIIY